MFWFWRQRMKEQVTIWICDIFCLWKTWCLTGSLIDLFDWFINMQKQAGFMCKQKRSVVFKAFRLNHPTYDVENVVCHVLHCFTVQRVCFLSCHWTSQWQARPPDKPKTVIVIPDPQEPALPPWRSSGSAGDDPKEPEKSDDPKEPPWRSSTASAGNDLVVCLA